MPGTVKRLFIYVAGASLMSIGFALPIGAVQSPTVGNWAVHDHGQGCWGGGNLRADGTGDGGGNCSVSGPGGQSIADLDPVSWSQVDANDVSLCADITAKKGTLFGPVGTVTFSCITVPVGTDGPVNLGGDTYGKVTLK